MTGSISLLSPTVFQIKSWLSNFDLIDLSPFDWLQGRGPCMQLTSGVVRKALVGVVRLGVIVSPPSALSLSLILNYPVLFIQWRQVSTSYMGCVCQVSNPLSNPSPFIFQFRPVSGATIILDTRRTGSTRPAIGALTVDAKAARALCFGTVST